MHACMFMCCVPYVSVQYDGGMRRSGWGTPLSPVHPQCRLSSHLCNPPFPCNPHPTPQVFEQGLSRVRACLSNVDSSCCLICLNHIAPTEAVWHCGRGCHTVLHLVCIQVGGRGRGRGQQGGGLGWGMSRACAVLGPTSHTIPTGRRRRVAAMLPPWRRRSGRVVRWTRPRPRRRRG